MLQLPPAKGLGDGPVPDLHVFCNEKPMSGVRNAVCSSQWDLDMHPSRVELLPSCESNFCCWYHHLLVLFDLDLNSALEVDQDSKALRRCLGSCPRVSYICHLLELCILAKTVGSHKQKPQTAATNRATNSNQRQPQNSRHKQWPEMHLMTKSERGIGYADMMPCAKLLEALLPGKEREKSAAAPRNCHPSLWGGRDLQYVRLACDLFLPAGGDDDDMMMTTAGESSGDDSDVTTTLGHNDGGRLGRRRHHGGNDDGKVAKLGSDARSASGRLRQRSARTTMRR
eukprot:s4554_g9.t1